MGRSGYFILLVVFTALGCSKPKMNSRIFGKQGDWKVTLLDINGNSTSTLPSWKVEESKDVHVFTKGVWKHEDGSTAQFKWRFNYYLGSFSFAINDTVPQEDNSKAFIQCSNLSGEYSIITDKRKLFEFESISTNGYGNQAVFIQLEPK